MGEFKGTPGPWSRDGYEFFNSDGANIFDLTYGSHTGINEDEANTNLIAAAPELFEALQCAIHHVREQAKSDAHAAGVLKACDAVINKALGQ
jgi:hypothetical protein